MNVFETLQKDVKDAMLTKMNVKRDCLRGMISEIKNETVNKGKPITDEVCLAVIKRGVKQRHDSVQSFMAGKREDLAVKETEEIAYLEAYLPKTLSADETRQLVDNVLLNIEAVKKNLGLVMRQLPPEADKKIASEYLKTVLK